MVTVRIGPLFLVNIVLPEYFRLLVIQFVAFQGSGTALFHRVKMTGGFPVRPAFVLGDSRSVVFLSRRCPTV